MLLDKHLNQSSALSNKQQQQQLPFCRDFLLHISVQKGADFFHCISHRPHYTQSSLRFTTIIISLVLRFVLFAAVVTELENGVKQGSVV